MIDNPIMTMDLLDRLTAALPFPARLTPELHASLRGQNLGGAIPTNCQGFDAGSPLAREITAYQKHRVKHLRRQPR
jgi:hypothetical protein